MKNWGGSLFAVALATILVAGASASLADETKSYRYGVTGNNIVFTTPEQALEGGSFQLAVSGGQPGKVAVELVDMFSDASGSKKAIPLNSSPFTPYGLVELAQNYPDYVPSEEFQYFDISFRFLENLELDRPVLGGVSISLVPDQQSESEVTVASSIVATFAYLPKDGLDLEMYAPGLSLSGPTVERITADFFPLNLLPNLPAVLNHGDVKIGYELTNTGKIFLETTTNLSVERVGLFGGSDDPVFSHSKTLFLVPGQQSAEIVDLVLEESPQNLLDIGIYRFSATATGEIGEQVSTSTSNQTTLLIFPWKQSFLALLLVVVFRRRIAKVFNWLASYAKALRDFRYSKDPKPNFAPEPKPDPLATWQKAETKPKTNSLDSTNKATPRAPVAGNSETRPLYPFWYEPPKKNGSS